VKEVESQYQPKKKFAFSTKSKKENDRYVSRIYFIITNINDFCLFSKEETITKDLLNQATAVPSIPVVFNSILVASRNSEAIDISSEVKSKGDANSQVLVRDCASITLSV
jgi:hypothetical protein